MVSRSSFSLESTAVVTFHIPFMLHTGLIIIDTHRKCNDNTNVNNNKQVQLTSIQNDALRILSGIS